MRKTKKHKKYSIEEKNKIVLLYLDKHIGIKAIIRKYDIASDSVLRHWVKQYQELGTCVDRRGKATKKEAPNKGRRKKYKVNLEELTKEQLIERIKMYEDVKKVDGLSNQSIAKIKYLVIDKLRHKYAVRLLCETLGCSKSGYYDWIKLDRPKYKAFDQVLNNLILEAYNEDTRRGIVQIRMNIKAAYGVCLTNSTVYRYMRLNKIQSICRRKIHTYPKVSAHEIPNLLQRNFNTNAPNKKWSIDISYIFCRDGLNYLCAIKDMYDKSIIAWRVSPFIDFKLVMDTVDEAIEKVPYNERFDLILHSDQGWHFTHAIYQQTLIDHGIKQSISAKGSSVDNAPIESFFAIIKTECIYLENNLTTQNLELIISEYVYYYNNNRLQEKIKELPPIIYRERALQSLF